MSHRIGPRIRKDDAPVLGRPASALPQALGDACTAAGRWGYINGPELAKLLGYIQEQGAIVSFWTAEGGECQAACIAEHGIKLALAYIRDGRLLDQWFHGQLLSYQQHGQPEKGYWNVPEAFEELMELPRAGYLTPNLATGAWRNGGKK